MWSQAAATVFCAVIALLAVFQLALAAGAPLGRLAWGGGHERLPTGLRVGSLISIFIYAAFAIIVLEASGTLSVPPVAAIAGAGAWIITVYMGLGVLMNAISRSKPERLVMTPVALVLCLSSLVVALKP